MTNRKVLITGASGLVGTRLTAMLLKKGYEVNSLGRERKSAKEEKRVQTGLKHFQWNVEDGKIDAKAFEGVSAIIHLAGAGVAEKRWSTDRKQTIVQSRVKGAQLIFNVLKKYPHEVKTFISASAVGYYGDCADEIVSEERKPGKGFLADVCKEWEKGAKQFSKLGIREVRCRIGIVLANKGGALPELTRTIPLGIASYFSKENLFYPWVHLDDVCGIFLHAIENEAMSGAYNTTAPNPLLMKDLMQKIVAAKKSSAVLLPAPSFALRIALGEMSEMLLGSQRCTAGKILQSGYQFKYGTIEAALKNLYP